MGEVGDAPSPPTPTGVATWPIAGMNWSTNQIPSRISAGISTRVTKKTMKIRVSTRARGM